MATWQPDLAPLISRIPRLFFLLKALGDDLHADLGVTTSMRGVMTSLATLGPRTVPDLARERPVSRRAYPQVKWSMRCWTPGSADLARQPGSAAGLH